MSKSKPKEKKTYRMRYVATVRGVLEFEAEDTQDARRQADEHGADFSTCEQADFEILSCREVE